MRTFYQILNKNPAELYYRKSYQVFPQSNVGLYQVRHV